MKQFVFLFRQGRNLSEEEQKRRSDDVRLWAARQVNEGRRPDPRRLGEESYRVAPDGESGLAQANREWPLIAIVFLEASDFGEAVKIAKTHPGIRYGVSVEVRAWTTPLAPPPAPAR